MNDRLMTARREMWLVDARCARRPGEAPRIVNLWAREMNTGREARVAEGDKWPSSPPYPAGGGDLVVFYDAPEALGGHLAQGWPLPANVLDLSAEARRALSGTVGPDDLPLAEALRLLGGGPSGDPLVALFEALSPRLDLPNALLRGRYAQSVARMEAAGVPIDLEALARLREGWGRARAALVAELDRPYGVYDGLKFNPWRWKRWLKRHGALWPRKSGRLDLRLKAFKHAARADPRFRPMKELRATLAWMARHPDALAVGADGRHRVPLRPYASKTGRNQPRGSVFNAASWLRGLVQPPPGRALAYLDYGQQELGIAAALSGDPALRSAYESGDPYLAFARQAGAVPEGATRQGHPAERERFKLCALGVQYGMTAWGLALCLGGDFEAAEALLADHKTTYAGYWAWSEEGVRRARGEGEVASPYGWRMAVGRGTKTTTLRNWRLQAEGAEMLRRACVLAAEAGVTVCAPVHDALLIEAPEAEIDGAVQAARRAMEEASRRVLGDLTLRVEHRVVRGPERLLSARGRPTWEGVFRLLGGGAYDATGRSASAPPGPCILAGVEVAPAARPFLVDVGSFSPGGLPVPGPCCASPVEKYLRGPIPLRWLAEAARLPGKALAVALAVQFLARVEGRGRDLALSTVLTEGRFGVDAKQKRAGLRALESAGLVRVERPPNRSPLVAVLPGWSPGRVPPPYLLGPVPLGWLKAACRLGARALAVALALWYLSGLRGGRKADLWLGPWALQQVGGCDRSGKSRALNALCRAGLVRLTPRRGQGPLVTILGAAPTA